MSTGVGGGNSNPATTTTTTTMAITSQANNNTNNSNPGSTTANTNQTQLQNQANSNSGSNLVELESQFILRMPVVKENGVVRPHPAALAIREALAEQRLSTNPTDDPLASRLFIDIDPETRKGRVKFDNDVFDARLVDLPCIVESLKTIDKKMFYKTSDICQMLVCRTRDDPAWSGDDEDDQAKSSNNKKKANETQAERFLRKYQWPHGITPPLKNVRRKRFRKLAKKKIIDYAEIEREVKQLFRADRDALGVAYEIVYMEGDEPGPGDDQDGVNDNGSRGGDVDLGNTKSKYDWDDDSMMSQDDSSSMMRRVKKSTGGATSTMKSSSMTGDGGGGGGGTGTGGEKNVKTKKEILDDVSGDNLFDENSTMIDEMVKERGRGGGDGDGDGAKKSGNGKTTAAAARRSKDESDDDEASNLESAVNFKNMFVKEVFGDFISSDDGGDDDDDDDDLGKNIIFFSYS